LILIIIIAVGFIFFEYGRRQKGVEIFFAPLHGCMLGAIYNVDELDDGFEHYMQVALFFVTLNIIFIKNE